MLSITRTWNAIGARLRHAAGARPGPGLRAPAPRSSARCSWTSRCTLDTLAELEAEYEGAFYLAFRAVELLGALEHGGGPEREARRAAVAHADPAREARPRASRRWRSRREAIESFGGAGYVEDTGLPRLLADAQVLPIWEGTTNVLSLDTLRALGKGGALEALGAEIERAVAGATAPALAAPVATARAAFRRAAAWVQEALPQPDRLEAGARRFALALGRSLELALLAGHAQWCLDHRPADGPRLAAAARRFALEGAERIFDAPLDDTRLLALIPKAEIASPGPAICASSSRFARSRSSASSVARRRRLTTRRGRRRTARRGAPAALLHWQWMRHAVALRVLVWPVVVVSVDCRRPRRDVFVSCAVSSRLNVSWPITSSPSWTTCQLPGPPQCAAISWVACSMALPRSPCSSMTPPAWLRWMTFALPQATSTKNKPTGELPEACPVLPGVTAG